MAVQAQYSRNAFRSGSNDWEEHEQQLQHQTSNLMTQNPSIGVIGRMESDLTSCNAYGFRKRNRDNEIIYHNQRTKLLVVDHASGSYPASTSGIHANQDLESYMDDQNHELKAFIQIQNQKLRAMVGLIMEEQILKRLEEKERELERANRVKRELEEKVKEKSEENQMWFNVAKQSEVTVFSLRQSLVQLLLYNKNEHAIEGYGETNGVHSESPTQQLIKTCKGCGGCDASILVLPCRHLCLCKHCEFRLKCCPVCNSVKNAALNVFYS